MLIENDDITKEIYIARIVKRDACKEFDEITINISEDLAIFLDEQLDKFQMEPEDILYNTFIEAFLNYIAKKNGVVYAFDEAIINVIEKHKLNIDDTYVIVDEKFNVIDQKIHNL